MEAAIRGGDAEVVRLLDEPFVPDEAPVQIRRATGRRMQKRRSPLESLLVAAIAHHRRDIFHWLVDTKVRGTDLVAHIMNVLVPAVFAANNLDALACIAALGVDFHAITSVPSIGRFARTVKTVAPLLPTRFAVHPRDCAAAGSLAIVERLRLGTHCRICCGT